MLFLKWYIVLHMVGLIAVHLYCTFVMVGTKSVILRLTFGLLVKINEPENIM